MTSVVAEDYCSLTVSLDKKGRQPAEPSHRVERFVHRYLAAAPDDGAALRHPGRLSSEGASMML
jgi:hypothetical protein